MLVRVVKKFAEVGFKNCLLVAKNRFNNFFAHRSLKKKSGANLDFLTDEFQEKFKIKDFEKYFENLSQKDFNFAKQYLKNFECQKAEIICQAEELLKDVHQVLGFGKLKKLSGTDLSWHQDVTVSNGFFDNFSFYKDIKFSAANAANLDIDIKADIKVPWHFSRFHHTTILGLAYQFTGNEKYAEKAQKEILDWIEKNPFLIGINWLCPMEAAIRSLNWIYFFYFFKNSKTISLNFWRQFTAILYQHLIYLENNWEIYDSKTNNHYLSDLLGYFYLSYFFDFKKELLWCFNEFLNELDKQIFEEGTSYEGSTSYHALVTEIVQHFLLLAQELNLEVDRKYLEKFKAMKTFLINTKFVKIGDDDSGQIVLGLKLNIKSPNENSIFYKDFGLSIFSSDKLHLTLRQGAYKKNQSSGHFHNDISSITLSLNEIPVIIDPGSYVYTASAYWRNYFRSINVHNTFFIENIVPIELSNNLFYLNLQEGHDSEIFESNNFYYKKFGLISKRKIDIQENIILIHDQWINLQNRDNNFTGCWNFTFAPEISLIKEGNDWQIIYKNKLLAHLKSDLKFEKIDGYVSLMYGQKQKCLRLFAKEEICLHLLDTISFRVIIIPSAWHFCLK
ncbi:heparinase II/III family protein [Candidatus Dependentiae bacterium]|nr:heparinase II/III family protein [Candidatus Dependentiae bacterium]